MISRNKLIELINNVPYYTRSANQYINCNQWSDIPIIEKKVVLENLNLFRKTINPSQLQQCRTSGSTGLILNVFWDQKDYLYSLKLLWNIRSRFNVKPLDLYGTNHTYIYDTYLNPISPQFVKNSNCISFSKLNLSYEQLEQYALHIKDSKLAWLLLQPTFAYEIGMISKQLNLSFPDLKFIELTGEMLNDEVKQAISDFFGVPVVNHYGMQEFNTIAYEDQTGHLRCCDNNVFVEILDDDNNPCTLGTEGNIVVSTLTNTYMPLIRYKTLDRGFLTENSGKKYLTITAARTKGLLSKNNISYDASLFFLLTERLNTFGYQIYHFQYHLKKNCLYCYLISSIKLDIMEVQEQIKKILDQSFNLSFEDIIVDLDPSNMSPTTGDKLQYFINYDSMIN